MSDADELTQRYLGLWTSYLTALLADPQAMETLKRWMAFTGRFSYPAPGAPNTAGAALPAWPPFFGPFGLSPGAATPTEPGVAADALARRVDELERRVAALERQSKPRRSRRADRSAGR